jgi:hypothetical protein
MNSMNRREFLVTPPVALVLAKCKIQPPVSTNRISKVSIQSAVDFTLGGFYFNQKSNVEPFSVNCTLFDSDGITLLSRKNFHSESIEAYSGIELEERHTNVWLDSYRALKGGESYSAELTINKSVDECGLIGRVKDSWGWFFVPFDVLEEWHLALSNCHGGRT